MGSGSFTRSKKWDLKMNPAPFFYPLGGRSK
jgi:hypothetical protein